MPPERGSRADLIARIGETLRRNGAAIRRAQWLVIAAYLVLLLVPAMLPLPDSTARIWNNATRLAQFVFWGIWWPFVLVSIVTLGRVWCGLLCPEGALTEFASRHGRHGAIPRWIRWPGWPFLGFAVTTIYGQLISVYQYPRATLLILGGSTSAAIVVGYLFGREKRVWCRYLCPVSGVFKLLARLAPVYYRVDPDQWSAGQNSRRRADIGPAFNCAPLVAVRTMKGGAECHMCGRCSGYRNAVQLSCRTPGQEIRQSDIARSPIETLLLLYGAIGIAMGAFHWSASPWLILVKQHSASWLIAADRLTLMTSTAPWWILTNYPAKNDVLTVLDGLLIVGYIAATAIIAGTTLLALLWSAQLCLPTDRRVIDELALCLTPTAAAGLFLGLSATTFTMLRQDGLVLDGISVLRAILLTGAGLWSLSLAWTVCGRHGQGARRIAATALFGIAIILASAGWAIQFWVW